MQLNFSTGASIVYLYISLIFYYVAILTLSRSVIGLSDILA